MCAREVSDFSLLLDVEVWSEDGADEAIATSTDVVMLDSIKGSELASVAWRLRLHWAG